MDTAIQLSPNCAVVLPAAMEATRTRKVGYLVQNFKPILRTQQTSGENQLLARVGFAPLTGLPENRAERLERSARSLPGSEHLPLKEHA